MRPLDLSLENRDAIPLYEDAGGSGPLNGPLKRDPIYGNDFDNAAENSFTLDFSGARYEPGDLERQIRDDVLSQKFTSSVLLPFQSGVSFDKWSDFYVDGKNTVQDFFTDDPDSGFFDEAVNTVKSALPSGTTVGLSLLSVVAIGALVFVAVKK